jgi:DNA-binding NarL/FixJ family response regulator
LDKIRILIADDHKILRESLVAYLTQKETFAVVGEASNGQEALKESIRLLPDVVILDISLPLLNGLDVAVQLKNEAPGIRVIILTMHKSEEFVRKAFQAGAAAYLLKENALEELLEAIEAVVQGGVYISNKIASIVVAGFLAGGGGSKQAETEQVSIREREILQLLAEGYSNREIADQLNLSLKTIETHRFNIMRKLGLHNIADLVLYAVRNHIIEV